MDASHMLYRASKRCAYRGTSRFWNGSNRKKAGRMKRLEKTVRSQALRRFGRAEAACQILDFENYDEELYYDWNSIEETREFLNWNKGA